MDYLMRVINKKYDVRIPLLITDVRIKGTGDEFATLIGGIVVLVATARWLSKHNIREVFDSPQ